VSYNTLLNQEGILTVDSEHFRFSALEVFRYQYENNPLYRAYCDALHTEVAAVKELTQIPFLPISFFKTHRVATGGWDEPALVFESSGTTGDIPSRHFVKDSVVYRRSLLRGFEDFYGSPGDYVILALLPSYLERQNASLVHMARVLMEESGHPDNGFYINEWSKLFAVIFRLEVEGKKVLLLGVTFALLDFAEAHPMKLTNTIVMETGGMKGRREELTRSQVHDILKQQWQLDNVHSEYGMTELLSQAYALRDGVFQCSPTMKALVRDINDPLDVKELGAGCLNIIDLANMYSCSFIATEDIGKIAENGTFEVQGRMDHSALRGCSLMVV
jgi:phenylacetate-coenzyme A ligase PaaK-like adenylate-forming protein